MDSTIPRTPPIESTTEKLFPLDPIEAKDANPERFLFDVLWLKPLFSNSVSFYYRTYTSHIN